MDNTSWKVGYSRESIWKKKGGGLLNLKDVYVKLIIKFRENVPKNTNKFLNKFDRVV